jgi:hypothetical protein
MRSSPFPSLYIRSKNELSKHISQKRFPASKTLALINDVVRHFDVYWKDNLKESEPAKGKYVRNAKYTPLGVLLKLINKTVLAPLDRHLPFFIFGGVSGKNHKNAAEHLLGIKRKRTILKMDVTRFFEHISEERVYHLFYKKLSCSDRAARLLAHLCCVPEGPKGSKSSCTIARGFATSPRLAVWCNLQVFLKLSYLVQRRLKGHDPRIAIYVDDIGITASRVPKEKMESLAKEVKKLLKTFDRNQPLPIKDEKTKIVSYMEGMEHLGMHLGRNKLSLGKKSYSKRRSIKTKLRKTSSEKRDLLKRQYRALTNYKRYVERS